jgi:uncharacterized protein (DUF2384 family)
VEPLEQRLGRRLSRQQGIRLAGLPRAWRHNVDLLGCEGAGSAIRSMGMPHVMGVKSVLSCVDISSSPADQLLVMA